MTESESQNSPEKQAAIDAAANIYQSLPENKRFAHLENHQCVMGRIDPQPGTKTIVSTVAIRCLSAIYEDLAAETRHAFDADYQWVLEHILPTNNA